MTHRADNGSPKSLTDTDHIVESWNRIKDMGLTQEQLNEIYNYGTLRYAQGFFNGRAYKDWA